MLFPQTIALSSITNKSAAPLAASGINAIAKTIPLAPTAEQLRAVHPDCAERRPYWQFLADCRDGFRTEEAKKRILPKGRTEDPDDYKMRVALARWGGFAGRAADRILAAVMETEPRRDNVESLAEFLANADGRGGSQSTVTRRAAELALWFGESYTLLDRPAADPLEDAPANKLQAVARGMEYPYAVIFSPLALMDYATDSRGNLTFAKLGVTLRDLSPDGKPISRQRFDYITPTESRVFYLESDGEITAGPTANRTAAPYMPLVPFYAPRDIRPPFADTPLAEALERDAARFVLEAERMFTLWMHGHAQLAIWTREQLSRVGIGAGKFIKLDPGDKDRSREDAKYLQLDTGGLAETAKASEEARRDSLTLSGVNPLGVLDGGPRAASGVSIAYTFETGEKRLLCDLAGGAETYEDALLATVAAAMQEDVEPDVTYPREFNMKDASWWAVHLGTLARNVPSPELYRIVAEKYAAALAGDVAPDVAKKIKAQIAEIGIPGPGAPPDLLG